MRVGYIPDHGAGLAMDHRRAGIAVVRRHGAGAGDSALNVVTTTTPWRTAGAARVAVSGSCRVLRCGRAQGHAAPNAAPPPLTRHPSPL